MDGEPGALQLMEMLRAVGRGLDGPAREVCLLEGREGGRDGAEGWGAAGGECGEPAGWSGRLLITDVPRRVRTGGKGEKSAESTPGVNCRGNVLKTRRQQTPLPVKVVSWPLALSGIRPGGLGRRLGGSSARPWRRVGPFPLPPPLQKAVPHLSQARDQGPFRCQGTPAQAPQPPWGPFPSSPAGAAP